MCLCLCRYARSVSLADTDTGSNVCPHTCTRSHFLSHTAAHSRLVANYRVWVGQEMLAFLRRSTSVKPAPASTPSTPSCNTADSVSSDTCPCPGQRVRVEGLIFYSKKCALMLLAVSVAVVAAVIHMTQ
jgi:hypothetical protein